MKILIAPDKFKGSLTAMEVCESIAKGLRRANKEFEILLHPLADGGEQSIDILAKAIPIKRIDLMVKGPLGKPILAHYYFDKDVAYIELAMASGLILVMPNEQSPMSTSTIGTGELMLHAINNGAKEINLFVGGSATNDGGMGIAQALGYLFLDKEEQVLIPIGKNLLKIKRIDNTNAVDLSEITINVLTDVKNPALGITGAANTFAKQKGASPKEVDGLEEGMKNLLRVLEQDDKPRMGAAGGVGVCLSSLLGAKLKSGIEFIILKTKFVEKLRVCDWIISGEGRLDSQSLVGKVISEVSRLAQKHNKPLVFIVGENKLSEEEVAELGVVYLSEILKQASSATFAMEQAALFLEEIAYGFGKNV